MNILTPVGDSAKPNNPKKSVVEKSKKGLFSLFDRELSIHEQSEEHGEERIDSLRQEIETLGDKLEKEPTLNHFSQFRDALSRLAKKINHEAYKLEKTGGTPQNPRYFEIITVIDREADRLYELIMQEQKNRLAITAKVIGIKGLVVDLIG